MKGTRHQEGYLYRKGSLWLLRYYDSEFAADGSVRRVQKTKKLAKFGLECPNNTAARDLAREFLESINLARNTPESAMTLIQFTEDRYLPFVEEHKRISTFRGYRNMWRRYLKPRCDIMLREFRTVDGERVLESIAKEHKLTSTTLAHIKPCRRNLCLFTRRDHADAEGAAGTSHDDRSCRRIYGCTQRRTARVALGELRRRAGTDLPVFLEGARAGAEDPTKQSASSSYRATRSTARFAPMLVRQSCQRIDVS